MPAGAPKKYNRKACLLKIHDELAKGITLVDICKTHKDLPTPESIYLWVAEDDELFNIFTRGQELWCWAQKDKIMQIADDDSRDVIENIIETTDEDGNVTIKVERRSDNTAVNRDKLRVGARQWAMTKLLNRIFGEKLQTEQTIKVETDYVDRPAEENYDAWLSRLKDRKNKEKPPVVN